jgi:hypothetical protein
LTCSGRWAAVSKRRRHRRDGRYCGVEVDIASATRCNARPGRGSCHGPTIARRGPFATKRPTALSRGRGATARRSVDEFDDGLRITPRPSFTRENRHLRRPSHGYELLADRLEGVEILDPRCTHKTYRSSC